MKKIVPAITVLVIVMLGLLLWIDRKEEMAQAEIYQEWDYLRQPISERVADLEKKISELDAELKDSMTPKGTIEILFTDLNKDVFDIAYPLLDEYDYTATLALSGTSLPGMDGCMTKEQFETLMDAGWETCVLYDGKELIPWWRTLREQLDNRDIKKPREIYFPHGKYKAEMDDMIKQLGFTIAIIKDNNKSPIVTKDEVDLWHVGAVGYMTSKARTWMEEAADKDGNVVFCVSFNEGNEQFQKPGFPSMLTLFDYSRASGDIAVMNVDEAREHYTSRVTGHNPKLEERYREKKERLESKLVDVKKKLEELDAQYDQLK